jgi:methyl-accepting chemotaxis protein
MEKKLINTQNMLDGAPVNVLFSTPEGILVYMNKSSEITLKSIEDLLPDKVEKLLNKSIDWFHKNPEIQKKIIKDPANLPHRALIKLGDETLDLLVTAVLSDEGDYLGAQVNWSIVTDKIKLEKEMARAMQMVEKAPINIMMATPDGTLIYMNKSTVDSLRKIESYLPTKVEGLKDHSIDWFHKNPEVQRRIIADPKNLPHRAKFELGGELLNLLVSPVFDNHDNYLGPMVTWEFVTEKEALEKEMVMAQNMVEKSPINTMMADKDGILKFLNEASLKTLKSIEESLPVSYDQIKGINIDKLHKNPARARSIFTDPTKLPHKAVISLGKEELSLKVAAVEDKNGEFLGPMVTWEVVTNEVELITNLSSASEELNSQASQLLQTANSLSAGAEETNAQANTASTASEEVNAGVQSVATNMDEMASAIKEITKTTSDSYKMSAAAKKLAQETNDIISNLGDSSMDIGNVIKVISSIAQQTNLLALNATIEAARAGEAGKGFAVVANEVKELAKQTARATNDITDKIENIQGDSRSAVQAIKDITEAIDKVNQYASNIAASVEEQASTTNEVTRVVNESAEGVRQITENIGQVSMAAETTGRDALNAQEAAKGLGEMANKIKGFVQKIKIN